MIERDDYISLGSPEYTCNPNPPQFDATNINKLGKCRADLKNMNLGIKKILTKLNLEICFQQKVAQG